MINCDKDIKDLKVLISEEEIQKKTCHSGGRYRKGLS